MPNQSEFEITIPKVLPEIPPDLSQKYPNWREQAKELGIPLFQRKKVDVLKEIESRLAEKQVVPEATKEVEKIIKSIEPIADHPKYEVGDLTPVEDLMGRIGVLETTVNQIIQRIDRLVDAVSKSKKTKGI